MEPRLIVANFKAEYDADRLMDWLDRFLAGYRPVTGIRVVLAVPCLVMERVAGKIASVSEVTLAGQAVSPFPPGRYTGALPAVWLRDLAEYALAGHRERLRHFHESVTDVAAQVREIRAAGLQPILCLQEDSLAALRAALDEDDLAVVLPAWTPGSAVSLESLPSRQGLEKGMARVRGYFPGRPILYGGGVQPADIKEILTIQGVAGVLLGRGCQDPAELAAVLPRLI